MLGQVRGAGGDHANPSGVVPVDGEEGKLQPPALDSSQGAHTSQGTDDLFQLALSELLTLRNPG